MIKLRTTNANISKYFFLSVLLNEIKLEILETLKHSI